jgi:hypothetical protein
MVFKKPIFCFYTEGSLLGRAKEKNKYHGEVTQVFYLCKKKLPKKWDMHLNVKRKSRKTKVFTAFLLGYLVDFINKEIQISSRNVFLFGFLINIQQVKCFFLTTKVCNDTTSATFTRLF